MPVNASAAVVAVSVSARSRLVVVPASASAAVVAVRVSARRRFVVVPVSASARGRRRQE